MNTQEKEPTFAAGKLFFGTAIQHLTTALFVFCVCNLNGQNAPAFTITNVTGSNSLTCAYPAVTLVTTSNHSAAVTYSWINGSYTLTGSSVQVTAPGTYSVYANSGTLMSMQTYVVPADYTAPFSALSPTFQNITCSPSSVMNVTAMITTPLGNVGHEWVSPLGGTLSVTGQNSVYTPGAPGIYTHVAVNHTSGCRTLKTFTVFSNSGYPTFSVQYSSILGCAPGTVGISITNANTYPVAGGAVSYTLLASVSPSNLSNGVLSSISNYTVASPGNYYVVVRDNSNLCTTSAQITISQNTLAPVVFLNSPLTEVCPGNTVVVYAYGADTYTFSGGLANGVPFTPTATGSYSVTGTNTLNGCSSAIVSTTITVHPKPVLTIITQTAICAGTSVALTASGAATYTWSNDLPNGQVFTPTASAGFSVTGTSTFGCASDVTTTSITIHSYPVLTISSSAFTVCQGDAVMLTGSGADVITWTGGVVNGQSFVPVATATYVAVGTNTAAGCSSTAQPLTINVKPLPVFSYTLTGLEASFSMVSGCTSFSWDYGNGQGADSSSNPVVIYTAPGSYNVCLRCTDGGVSCKQCMKLDLPGSGSGTVGIKEIKTPQHLYVYPNPFCDYLEIAVEQPGMLRVYNSQGILLVEEKTHQMQTRLNLNSLPAGIYFLSYTNGNVCELVKVLKL